MTERPMRPDERYEAILQLMELTKRKHVDFREGELTEEEFVAQLTSLRKAIERLLSE